MAGTDRAVRVETGEFYIARMSEHDLLEVVEIEEASGLSRWGWEAYHAELKKEDEAIMLVARSARHSSQGRSEGIIGFIATRITAGEVHINNMAVRGALRRRGIGATLLEAALREARQRGAHGAILEVRVGNGSAQALYQKYGFKVIGRRQFYYADPSEDAFVMSVAILNEA